MRLPDDPSPPDKSEAYQRLLALAKEAGLSVDRLSSLLRQLAHNKAETRRFLMDVYGVSDSSLEDLLRLRLEEIGEDGSDDG